jgi:serine/threonine-protein kinase
MTIEEANSGIRDAWVAGVISIGATMIITLSYITGLGNGIGWGNIDQVTLLDMAITAVLSFGIYKKSRACAILLFVYFIYMRIIMPWMDENVLIGVPFTLIFLYFIGKGVRGTIVYHKLVGNNE